MDKRSFIRGFGVGVLFTALILGVSFVVRTSDAYVKSQALKLGMVYQKEPGEDLVFASSEPGAGDDKNTDNSDGDKKDKNPKESAKPKSSAAPKASAKPKKTAAPKSSTKPQKTAAPKNSAAASSAKPRKTVAPQKTAVPVTSNSPLATKKPSTVQTTPKPTRPKRTSAPKGKQTLTIAAGEWSSDVCEKLERMGIIKNAKQFDKYLNDNGYSERINAGTYSVSVDDTYEQLARKITKR